MQRREFIKSCGTICFAGLGILSLTECTPTKYIVPEHNNNMLVIRLKDFEFENKGVTQYRKVIILNSPELEFPVAVFRYSSTEYSAVYMRCTHQGAELQLMGDKFECPAHGSLFSNKGLVENGPAEDHLKSFQTQLITDKLYISLS
jgi:Rieske Fe-S protein